MEIVSKVWTIDDNKTGFEVEIRFSKVSIPSEPRRRVTDVAGLSGFRIAVKRVRNDELDVRESTRFLSPRYCVDSLFVNTLVLLRRSLKSNENRMLPSRTRLIKFKTQSYPRLQVSSKWLAELDFLDSESLNPCENDNAGVLFCEWRVFYAHLQFCLSTSNTTPSSLTQLSNKTIRFFNGIVHGIKQRRDVPVDAVQLAFQGANGGRIKIVLQVKHIILQC